MISKSFYAVSRSEESALHELEVFLEDDAGEFSTYEEAKENCDVMNNIYHDDRYKVFYITAESRICTGPVE